MARTKKPQAAGLRVRWQGITCVPTLSKYQVDPNVPALYLLDDHGEVVAVASVYLTTYTPQAGDILIKTWSENEGLLEVLEAAGLVKDTGIKIATGFVSASLCKLLMGREVRDGKW